MTNGEILQPASEEKRHCCVHLKKSISLEFLAPYLIEAVRSPDRHLPCHQPLPGQTPSFVCKPQVWHAIANL